MLQFILSGQCLFKDEVYRKSKSPFSKAMTPSNKNKNYKCSTKITQDRIIFHNYLIFKLYYEGNPDYKNFIICLKIRLWFFLRSSVISKSHFNLTSNNFRRHVRLVQLLTTVKSRWTGAKRVSTDFFLSPRPRMVPWAHKLFGNPLLRFWTCLLALWFSL